MNSFLLHLIHENGQEQQVVQAQPVEYNFDGNRFWINKNRDFSVYKRESPSYLWIKVEKHRSYYPNHFYGEPLGMQTLSAEWRGAAMPTPQILVDTGSHYYQRPARHRTGAATATEISHREHVRQHELAAREIQRREEQREADRRRLEEERNRPRTPWQRFRNYLGGNNA